MFVPFVPTIVALSDWLSQTSSLLPGAAQAGMDVLSGAGAPGSAPAHAWVPWLLALVVFVLFLLPLAINISVWVLWILVSILVGIGRFFYTIFVLIHVICDVWCLSAMKSCYTVYRFFRRCARAFI